MGLNSYGQLGDGTYSLWPEPVPVKLPSGTGKIVSVTAALDTTCYC